MQFYEIAIRLMLAILIGGAIGYEREFKNRPAGFRTHILVCVGATAISMIQVSSIIEITTMILNHSGLKSGLKADIGRMCAQVIKGVGFLGAGTIIYEKGSIKGLTTAASLWLVACIGLAIGMGYYVLSILSGIGVLIILISLKNFEVKFIDKNKLIKVEVQYRNNKLFNNDLEIYFKSRRIKIKNIEYCIEDEEEEKEINYKRSLYTLVVPKHIDKNQLLQQLLENKDIVKVSDI